MRQIQRLLATTTLLLSGASAAFAAPAVVLQPSRTSGVAPLAVHFDATGTTESGLDSFRQLSYRWDFGDPNAGTWQFSGRPKNEAIGPVAAHVFETPGTFTVQLRVANPSGGMTTRTVSIAVSDPDAVYSGSNTICVSSSGSFAGCPAGAQRLTSNSFNTALGYAGPGKRVLLRRGETFDAPGAGVNRAGPATVGAFPATGTPPLVRATTTGSIMKLSGATETFDDWRIMDIDFEGPGVSGSHVVSVLGRITRLLLLRVSAEFFHQPLSVSHGPANAMHEGVFVVESVLAHMRGGVGGNGGYMSSNRGAFLGSRFEDSTQVEHVLRLPYFGWGVMSHNYFANAAHSKHLLKLHSLGETDSHPFPERRSHDFVISDNTFVGGINGWDVTLGPQSSTEDERVYRAIVERNLFRAGAAGSVTLLVWASDVTVRNNVFDLSAAGGGDGVLIARRGIEPPPANDEVNSNTCFTATGNVECARFASGTGHSSLNNLAVGGTGSSASGLGGASNIVLATPTWLSTAPSKLSDFKTDPARGSAVIDTGASVAEATLDPLGVIQPADGDQDGVARWDIGAFEVGTPSSGGGGGPPGPPPPPTTAPAAPVLLP